MAGTDLRFLCIICIFWNRFALHRSMQSQRYAVRISAFRHGSWEEPLHSLPHWLSLVEFKSISSVCEKLVPFMALFYVIGCIVILGINIDFLFPALKTIVTLAFQPGAAAGGLTGGGIMLALHYGVARGLFSNESGMGSAPIAAAAAQTRNPVRQALVSATGTFWDTVVVCAMTGLVLVTSIMKNPSIDIWKCVQRRRC